MNADVLQLATTLPATATGRLEPNLLAAVLGVQNLAVGAILAGIACQLLHRRLPRGLGTSLFVFGTTVGIGVAAFHYQWPPWRDYYRVCLIGSLLAALWAFLGQHAARSTEATAEEQLDGGSAAFLAWSFVSGVATATLIVYVLINATWLRVIDPYISIVKLEYQGLLVIAGLLTAILVWLGHASRPRQPALLLGLCGLFVWWTSLMIPSASLSGDIPPALRLPLQPGWWTWTFQLQFGFAVVLVCAALIQDSRYRSRRKSAWPDRLDDLIQPYSAWPGYIQIEAILSAMELVLGVYQIVRAGGPGWQLPLANCVASAIAAATCLYMTYRRWSPNTAGLGMSLLSLAVVALACTLATPFFPATQTLEYADRMPILFNAILFALWLMLAFWHGLARLWDQQLLDGVAWTTAGRMIPYVQRTAFLLTAIAVLIAYQMALWPARPVAVNEDNSLLRLICGGGIMLLLAAQNLREARRGGAVSIATMSITLFIGVLVFLFVRMPPSAFRGWLIQYYTIVFCAASLLTLMIAEALPRTGWKSFSTPLWGLAVLILPLWVLAGLLRPSNLPEAWVRPLSLAMLALVFAFVGGRERRRAFLLLGLALFVAAAIGTYRLFW